MMCSTNQSRSVFWAI